MNAVLTPSSTRQFPFARPVQHTMPANPFKAPKPAHGIVEYEWDGDITVPVVCHLEHTPAERGSRERGLQMEPDYDESLTLCEAYVNGCDIYNLLSADQVRRIEEIALVELHDRAYDERAEAAVEARMA